MDDPVLDTLAPNSYFTMNLLYFEASIPEIVNE